MRHTIQWALAGACLLVLPSNRAEAEPAGSPRPNILFVFADDQRFGTASGFGNAEIETPNLDRLMERGTTFTRAYIMGSTSAAVCIPSRAMMLTGRTLFSLERIGQHIPTEHVTLPEWLRRNDYTTVHIGKWHQDRASFRRAYTTGAKIFGFGNRNWMKTNGHWHTPVHDFDPAGVYAEGAAYNDPPSAPFVPSPERTVETTKEDGRHSVDVFSDAAIDFIRRYPATEVGKAGVPFYLQLAHVAPHDPRQYPSRFKSRYHAQTVSLPVNFATEHAFDNGGLSIRDELLEQHPRRPEAVRRHLADYYASIAHLDERLGDVLSALEQSGQAGNTIIIYSSDNGLAVGQHGLMGKQNLYDCSVHVPLIIAGPGIPANRRSDAWCYLSDLFPTLCDLTSLPTPGTVEGKSLAPVIAGSAGGVRDSIFHAYRGEQRAVRRGGYKLIEYMVKGRRTTQLFNMVKDPWERENLADEPRHAEELNRLREELVRWQEKLGDQTSLGLSARDGS